MPIPTKKNKQKKKNHKLQFLKKKTTNFFHKNYRDYQLKKDHAQFYVVISKHFYHNAFVNQYILMFASHGFPDVNLLGSSPGSAMQSAQIRVL